MRLICTLLLLLSLLCGCNYESGDSAQIDAWNKQYDQQLNATDRQLQKSGQQLQQTDKLQKQLAELLNTMSESVENDGKIDESERMQV